MQYLVIDPQEKTLTESVGSESKQCATIVAQPWAGMAARFIIRPLLWVQGGMSLQET